MLTLTHNDGMFTVSGTVKDEDNNKVNVVESSFKYERAIKCLNYYSHINGFKGQRLNLVPDNLRK